MTYRKRRKAVRQRSHCFGSVFSRPILLLMFTLAAPGAQLRASEYSRQAYFNIPSQPLDTALLAFSEQADMQIVAATANITGLKTAGVKGERVPDVALACLLKGTGLRFKSMGRRTYVVAPA